MNALLLSLACADPTSAADTAAGDSGAPAPPPVDATFLIEDYASGDPIEGATETTSEGSSTTDEDGEVTVPVAASADFDAVSSAEGRLDCHLVGRAESEPFTIYFAWPSRSALSTLASVLDLEVDTTKGLLVVNLHDRTNGDDVPLPGATADIDLPYEVALAAADSAVGFAPGNTTIEGAASEIVFANVSPGTANLTLSLPRNTTCTVFPSNVPTIAMGVYADALTNILFTCVRDR